MLYLTSLGLMYIWKIVLFDPLHPLCPSPTSACSFYMSLVYCFSDSTSNWDHAVFVFLCLISFSIMALSSIHVVAKSKISFFLWLNSIPLYTYIYTPHLYPFILWWMGCFHILAIVVNAAVNTEVHIFGGEGFRVLFSLDKHREVELLDHVVALFLAF